MKNIYNNLKFNKTNFDKNIHINKKELFVAQIYLLKDQNVPKHNANSDVIIVVVEGNLEIVVNEDKTILEAGDIFEIKNLSPMEIFNTKSEKASFMVIKAPNPNL